jgi:hypothetical protein
VTSSDYGSDTFKYLSSYDISHSYSELSLVIPIKEFHMPALSHARYL